MTFGVVMLVHTAFDRAEQAARHWSAFGCPIVVHVDRCVDRKTRDAFARAVSDLPNLSFSRRYRSEWGTWGIVAATQYAAEQMLARHPEVNHVFLASGACLPLRPVSELAAYLAARPETDFIESVTTADVPWTVGGLQEERFTLRFPFPWKRRRALFDRYVALQRRLGVKRKIPNGIVPHMGSQWWCLTRRTLSAILRDPSRARYDRYFRRVWVPDESYFQTLVRRHAIQLESRSLTLSKFDRRGRPHVFYDDHLPLLRRSECFVARKIWRHSDQLYAAFPIHRPTGQVAREPNPGQIDRALAKAVETQAPINPALHMRSRYLWHSDDTQMTAAPYSVFQGFSDLFENFEAWLTRATEARVHGHLFAPDRAHFTSGQTSSDGALSDSATLRDYNPHAFLQNLIWNTRGQHQCFQFGPADNQSINWQVAKDPNARISVITGAWAIPLFQSADDFGTLRKRAARFQKIESEHLKVLGSSWTKARIRIWTLADFVATPMEPLLTILNDIGSTSPRGLSEVPRMADLDGFGAFLQKLKNEGMHPYLVGDFPVEPMPLEEDDARRERPYLVG
ncbi:glycosyl transferase [Roseobacter cerasinus]|uniref:Peptide O-xylosyltransferase n=1 Tax=Roseobacter cerasinus TaxID=2602289 RepID=A0A640VNS9_9RHOB|nr:beta-1,6-N-acetylglucosaminyltransferase [Roseobacter cerasinus]GFE49294.1 glycosyl transferase [Roseobacter cerasinus]